MNSPIMIPRPSRLGAAITTGVGTAIVMWLVGFLTHLPAIRMAPIAVAAMLLVAQGLGGFYVGRRVPTARAPLAGLAAGVVTALINLLVVGSVVASAEQTDALRPGWALIVGGSIVFSAALGLAGAVIASRMPARFRPEPDLPQRRLWLARYSRVAVLAAIPVLLSGGLVTSTGAGLAVPDWPTSYSANMFLYPLAKMTGGIYYEHAHRLFGSLVGLTTLALLVFALVAEPRRWVKALALFAFLFVCGQGVLGGIRVTAADTVSQTLSHQTLADNKGSLMLAMVHGITAQLLVALLAAIAAVASRAWIARTSPTGHADRALRIFSIALFAGLVLQLAMGSAARHLHHPHTLWSHVGFAAVLFALTAFTAFRAMSRHRATPPIRRLGHALLHTVILQILLGVITLVLVLPYQQGKEDSPAAVVLATAHQGVGALLIALAAALIAWSYRLGAGPRAAAHAPGIVPTA